MLEIFEVKKVEREDEKVTISFEIDKDLVDSFTLMLHALSELNGGVSAKIRQATARQRAELEARQGTVRASHEVTKEGIRKTYLEHLKRIKDIKQAFKQTRKEYLLYSWLVKEVRDEFRAKRELEIFRLHNLGEAPPEIGEKLYMSPGAVRRVIGAWKYHRPNPLEP